MGEFVNQNYTMEKIMTFTDEQREKLRHTKQTKWIKELLGIPIEQKYAIGDSAVDTKLEDIQVNDVLKCTWNGRVSYDVVAMLMSGTVAFCYTIYPIE